METLSLTWDSHQNNICSGLSRLQQRGEFVDMTLAADGHHVKVHQMVMSLVSPYIKELISTAQCPHPVIFLNNISYTTLCAILEYIYTGQVHLPKEKLPDFLAAGKALHIKGLREMDNDNATPTYIDKQQPNKNVEPDESVEISNTAENTSLKYTVGKDKKLRTEGKNMEYGNSQVQYSISNQGNLQVIINRYIYNLKYVQKNSIRYWRCVDYAYRKCPASVYTNDKNVVLRRKCNHNHPFHDKKIIKKVRMGTVFTAFNEAENRAKDKKIGESIQIVAPPKETTDAD